MMLARRDRPRSHLPSAKETIMRSKITAAVVALGMASTAAADDLDRLQYLAQSQVRALSEDLGAALSNKHVSPAEPLGLIGFDVGLEVTATEIQAEQARGQASSGGDDSTMLVPKHHVIKGLPHGIDVGACYSAVPDSNINLWGGELRYALLKGGTLSPAGALRGTYTKLSGVDQLDFDTKGIEASISKCFAMLTPYAGIGRVWIDSSLNVSTLSSESFQQNKFYVGANLNLALINLALEYDHTGDDNTYGAKLGLRF